MKSNFTEFSDEELKEYLRDLYQAFNVIRSYSMKDRLNYGNAYDELERRGIEVVESSELYFEEKDVD